MYENINEQARELINEPGSIGEEQLPQDSVGKNDKQEWTYAADKVSEDITWWQRVQKFFRGGT
jgi:hypothetical protein